MALLWLGTEIKVSICAGKRFESPMVTKEGNMAPRLCYQLVQLWGKGGEVGLTSCQLSNIKKRTLIPFHMCYSCALVSPCLLFQVGPFSTEKS